MPALIDTHVVLWWFGGDARLSDAVRDRMNVDRDVVVSVVSIWEAAIKQAAGRLQAPENIGERIRGAGFTVLPISADHATAAASLPPHHRDPFDRMLIGQALVEGLTVMTSDRAFAAYDVPLEPV